MLATILRMSAVFSCHLRRVRAVAPFVMLACSWAAPVLAGVSWHPDLTTACRASAATHRPVLAIFTASWSSVSATLDRTTLASDEAVALITACFEPVCLDVDACAEATRRLGVSKVPTACILTADGQPLSTFELPETPAEFVVAAARAAQEAALATAALNSRLPPIASEQANRFRGLPDTGGQGFNAVPGSAGVVGTSLGGPMGDSRGTVAPGGQAITAVAAKVRRLSDFASETAPPTAHASAIADSFRDSVPSLPAARPSNPPATVAASTGSASTVVTPSATTPSDTMPSSTAPWPAAPAAATPAPAADIAASTPFPAPAAAEARDGSAGAALPKTPPTTPLNIEPTPRVADATGPQSMPQTAPWLGAAQSAEPPTPETRRQPEAAVATAPPGGQTQGLASRQAVPAPARTEPAPDGGALAESKPSKPERNASSAWLSALQKPFDLFAKPAAKKPKPGRVEADRKPPAGSSEAVAAAPAPEADPYGSMPVGLEGYCPVTLAERGAWVEGRAQWGARHRGRTYLFAGADQQKTFLADPDRYVPALSGDDPVLACDAGKSTPGQRRYGVTYQSKMYLFSSPETRDTFAANPQRYTTGSLVAENRVPATAPVVR